MKGQTEGGEVSPERSKFVALKADSVELGASYVEGQPIPFSYQLGNLWEHYRAYKLSCSLFTLDGISRTENGQHLFSGRPNRI